MGKVNFDKILFFSALALTFVGLLSLASVSAFFSQQTYGESSYNFFHQIEWGILPGIILGFIFYKIPLDSIKKIALPIFLFSLVLMLLVFLPVLGLKIYGAQRWLNFRFFTIQPSDILKPAFCLYLSVWLANRTENDQFFKSKKSKAKDEVEKKHIFLPFLAFVFLMSALLFFQKDLGTLIIIFVSAGAMFFAAKTPFWQTLALILVIISLTVALIFGSSYRMRRLTDFLNPKTNAQGTGYQVNQSLIAIGSGGIFGSGFGASKNRSGSIPQIMSDSVFAVFAEETGFLGCLTLVGLFLLFSWRCLKTAKFSENEFAKIFSVGYCVWIIFQAFINISASVKLLPFTGIPLPFISYGGTHIIAELAALGIILNISKFCKK